MRKEFIIGIDPDKEKSGLAALDITDGKKLLLLETFEFPELIEYCLALNDQVANYIAHEHEASLKVFIEASWISSSIWHLSNTDNPRVAAKKGYCVAENHQTGKLIARMLERGGVEVHQRKPFLKVWKRENRKISHDELMRELEAYDITLYPPKKRSNQEERDAALMAIYNA